MANKTKRRNRKQALGFILILAALTIFSFILFQKVNGRHSIKATVEDFREEIKEQKKSVSNTNNKSKEKEKQKEEVKLNLQKVERPIGIITIPKIGEEIPIYRTESENSLDKGVIVYARQNPKIEISKNASIEEIMLSKIKEELSLDPDINKNIVLSGHSGTSLSNLDIFLNVNKLDKGDIYIINDGDFERYYKIFETEIIEPSEGYKVYQYDKDNKKLSTLYTCISPNGIRTNTHRFIAHAELIKEIEYNPEEKVAEREIKEYNKIGFFEKMDIANKIALIGFILIFILVIVIIVKNIRNKTKGRANEKTKNK